MRPTMHDLLCIPTTTTRYRLVVSPDVYGIPWEARIVKDERVPQQPCSVQSTTPVPCSSPRCLHIENMLQPNTTNAVHINAVGLFLASSPHFPNMPYSKFRTLILIILWAPVLAYMSAHGDPCTSMGDAGGDDLCLIDEEGNFT